MVKDLIFITYIDHSENSYTVERIAVPTKKTIPTYSNFNPEENQKIYIPSHIDIPRTKFKDHIKSKSIRVTTNLDDSDIVVLDEDFTDFVNEESYRAWTYKYETRIFLEEIADTLPDVVDIFKDYKHPYFFVSNNVHQHFTDFVNNDDLCEYHPIRIFRDTERVETILSKTIINPKDIMESMQENETVIDRDYYKQLDNMLKSSDADNHVVAMEIMANSNYTKSCVYLMILIMDNYQAIDNSRTKRHVNFKSLLNYLKLHPSSLSVTVNSIIYFMDARGLLTIETLDILRDEVLQNSVYAHHFKAGSGELVQPIEVALDNEPIRKINNNKPYTFKTTYGREN